MRITINRQTGGVVMGGRAYRPGRTYDVNETDARELLRAGYATLADEIETTAVAPARNAMRKKAKPRKRA